MTIAGYKIRSIQFEITCEFRLKAYVSKQKSTKDITMINLCNKNCKPMDIANQWTPKISGGIKGIISTPFNILCFITLL